MSILNHNIYDNVRTRVIVLHKGCVLMLLLQETGAGWRPPGGGIEPQESLAECAIREVLEETGIRVRISGVAFLREWVVPKYCPMPDGKEEVGFGLEVYLYGYPTGEPSAPRAERADLQAACWASSYSARAALTAYYFARMAVISQMSAVVALGFPDLHFTNGSSHFTT